MPKKKFARQTRRQEKAGNLNIEEVSWRELLHIFDKIVSSPANKLVGSLMESSNFGESQQNQFVSTPTNNNNNKNTSTTQQGRQKVSTSANKLIEKIASFCNDELQLLRDKEGLARLLCILLDQKAVFLNSASIRTYYRRKYKGKAELWWTLYNQDADDLVHLGFATKEELHPDALSQSLGRGRKPFVLCIKNCPERIWRAVSLDVVNWRQKGHSLEPEESMPKRQRTPTEQEIIKASHPKQEPIHRIAKTRKEAEPLYREKFKAMGFSGDALETHVQDSLNQHYPKKRKKKRKTKHSEILKVPPELGPMDQFEYTEEK